MRFKTTLLFFVVAAAAAAAGRFGLEHAGKIVRLSDPQISPDGRSIALVVSRTNLRTIATALIFANVASVQTFRSYPGYVHLALILEDAVVEVEPVDS